WPEYSVRRVYRGVEYLISVRREGDGGDVTVVVDNELIDGDVVPLPPPGTKKVEVEILIM
ncbi:MAG: hypothetical protein ACK2T3_13880, partial [Candidatus Promineifilaceae bacterium]